MFRTSPVLCPLLFEQGALHFHFALGPAHCAAGYTMVISSSAPGHQRQTLERLGAFVWPQWPSCLWKMELKILETRVPSLPVMVLLALRLALPGPRRDRMTASPTFHLGLSKLERQTTDPGYPVTFEFQKEKLHFR